jgi:NAD(P)-dependent dehydrogenase (short-subunit alcohol dehydrogenase family)
MTFIRCDVTKEEEWTELWNHAEVELNGKVALLVNNAGINPSHGWKLCVDIMLNGVGIGTFMAVDKMGTSKVSNFGQKC